MTQKTEEFKKDVYKKIHSNGKAHILYFASIIRVIKASTMKVLRYVVNAEEEEMLRKF
jgi:hypothetical protein